MLLNHQIVHPGFMPLFYAHGVLGHLQNWKLIASKLDPVTSYLVDCRNHGKSFHQSTMTYQEMADDFLELINHYHLDKVNLLGHSMGGKIMMEFAKNYPEKIDKMIIVDIAPDSSDSDFVVYFKALMKLDLAKFQSREEVSQVLEKDIPDISIRRFLLTNLKRDSQQKLDWQINMKGIYQNIDVLRGDLQLSKPIDVETLFIRGEYSNYITDDKWINQIKPVFPQAHLKTIHHTGHWPHAQKPKEFAHLIKEFLNL